MTATVKQDQAISREEQARTYIDLVLPKEKAGEVFFISKGKSFAHPAEPFNNKFYRSIDEVIERSLKWSDQGYNSYIAMGRFTGDGVISRKADRATSFKSFFLDIDIKPEGNSYRDAKTAQEALRDFKEKTGLPHPTLIIRSGSGVHIYWAFDEEVSADDWVSSAEKLKALHTGLGFLADGSVTADRARVLRLPGTCNHKKETPVLVDKSHTGESFDFETLKDIIDEAYEKLGSDNKGSTPSSTVIGPSNNVIFLNVKPEHITTRKSTARDIVDPDDAETPENIERVKSALFSLSADCPRGEWMSYILAIASLGWECGLDLADEWSKTAPARYEGKESVRKIYDSYDPTKPGKITLGSLIQKAKENGWIDPRTVKAPVQISADSGSGAGVTADDSWTKGLSRNNKGLVEDSFPNLVDIMRHHPEIVSASRYNVLSNGIEFLKNGSWRHQEETDITSLRATLCKQFGWKNIYEKDCYASIELSAKERPFHPIVNYLKSLEWDGVPRVDNLLINQFGAANTPFHREAIRCWMIAAVRRVTAPGYKYDRCLVLFGLQGKGKSEFFTRLGLTKYYSALNSFEEKQLVEVTNGKWIVLIDELDAYYKADMNRVKTALSARGSKVRLSYERTAKEFPRQVVFGATTNEINFLKDSTGNRRFDPIKINQMFDYDGFDRSLVDQLWAEAFQMHLEGLSTELSEKALKEAEIIRNSVREVDDLEGVIQKHLKEKYESIKYVCKIELINKLIFEGFIHESRKSDKVFGARVGKILDSMTRFGWERVPGSGKRRFENYGPQIAWEFKPKED